MLLLKSDSSFRWFSSRAQSAMGSRLVRVCFLIAMIGIADIPYAAAQGLEDEEGPLPTVKITPGRVRAFQAAVLRFHEEGAPVGPERIEKLREETERALAFSSVVLPLTREAYLAEEQSPPLSARERVDCESWRQNGVEAVVQGQVRRDGEKLRADIRVWDVARCRELKTGSIVGDRDRMDQLGRLIADETVEALTGTRGVSATELAFISNRTGNREVFVMDADGRNQRRATNSNSIKMFPDWLPDGRGLLYVSYDGLQPGFFLSSRSPALTPGPILRKVLPGVAKYRGRFDPTGEELAMVASVDGAAEIFRVKRKSNESVRLTNNSEIDIAPSWSPSGNELVFVSDRSGAPQLYIMDRNGDNLRRLTFTGSYNSAPTWSPDGRWIAYETRVRGQFDIWLIDPTGEINFPIVEHPQSDEAPSWSPDGRKLAFSSRRRGRFDLYVMDWNGENVQRLTQRSGDNIHAAWGPSVR